MLIFGLDYLSFSRLVSNSCFYATFNLLGQLINDAVQQGLLTENVTAHARLQFDVMILVLGMVGGGVVVSALKPL